MRRILGAALLGAALAAAGCGGSGGGSPRATVERYLTALSRGDAAGACGTFTPETRAHLAAFGAQTLRLKKRSCAATIGALFGTSGGARLRQLGRARIVSVVEHGDKADVRIAGIDAPAQLVRDGGKWLISSQPSGESD